VPEPHDNESGSVGSSAEFSNFSVDLSVCFALASKDYYFLILQPLKLMAEG
jgi:hypothetical protein